MIYTTHYDSPLGPLYLAGDEKALVGAWFEGQKYFARTLPADHREGETAALQQVKVWLDRYFGGEKPTVEGLPLAPRGSSFQQTIWQLLLEIPYGKVTTYGQLGKEAARRLGRETMSAQAVGGAVGHNPISVIIPCHRVVGSNGSLTGYAGGLDIKIDLLEREGVDMGRLYRPKKGTAI